MSKARQGAERITSQLSSSIIVDQFEGRSTTIMGKLKNMVKTRLVLSQTEATFLDFNRTQFPKFAQSRYLELLTAFHRKDKVDMLKLLSIPMYEIFKHSLKNNNNLPFDLHKNIIDSTLSQARIYSAHKHGLNSAQTWHQMTIKFQFQDEGKSIEKFNVFERRECDTSITDWRVCYLE